MSKTEYIKELKRMLLEDLNTEGDVSPNIVNVKLLHHKYPEVTENVLAQAQSKAVWLETYFMHCRHCRRPIDKELAKGLIDSLNYI